MLLKSIRKKIDLVTFGIYLGLVAIGWLMIFTVGYKETGYSENFFNTPIGSQTIWIGICLTLFAFIQLIDWKFWQSMAFPIYGVSIALLLGLLFFGVTIKGATSWYRLGSFTFQPSEIAKFGTCLAIAALLGRYNANLRKIKWIFYTLILITVPIILILSQPDAGSALVFIAFLVVMYRAGLSESIYIFGFYSAALLILGFVFPPIYIIQSLIVLATFAIVYHFKPKSYWRLGMLVYAGLLIFLYMDLPNLPNVPKENIEGETMGKDFTNAYYFLSGTIVIFLGLAFALWRNKKERKERLVNFLLIALLWGSMVSVGANYLFNNVLKPHQQDRINVWLRPHLTDPQRSRYNLINSQMAIGSGGLQGKGFLEGTMTKLNYVPEQTTDFIFCTIGEEQGFIGSIGIIFLFLLLLYRITIIAERQRNNFIRYYAYGVAGIIFVHFFINIGMTMGVVPIIGIPLPFISKGGSSLLGFTIMLAVLLKMDSSRHARV
ncbi:MAG: rod shape-determining protein RodA [Saprospiraceae bacterium]|nr:MAG: rod shape-determining protein RodA [Saprospiraceae bacterium]